MSMHHVTQEETAAEATMPDRIVRHLVKDDRRFGILPKYAGKHFLALECTIFNVMGEYCEHYKGGLWTMWELSNGSFYMSPQLSDSDVVMRCSANHYEGSMSADAAGIVSCLVAFNRLTWSTRDERLCDLFYGLRDWAIQHPECREILRAID